ncbi:BC_2427 family protein [Lysinibacillus xylanilyticus]|uniref:BC_2427 family protein n=1 Tax=Lysinibacillus xylanilyticus TaxID=582475 RepID=UPI00382C7CB2
MKTPWINYSEMKEISSKQKVFINFNYLTKPRKKIDHESQKNSTFEVLNSPYSDFVNHPLDIEKEEDETNSLAEEHELATHLDSNHELLIPSEIVVEDEMNEVLDIEEVDKTNPVEEHELATHLDSNHELLIPPEIDVENEVNDVLDIEAADKIKPIEEQELATHLDSNHELLIPPEIDVEDEMNDVLDIEAADKIKPIEEQGLEVHLDSDYELLTPSEIDVEDEMNDLLDIEEADKIKPVEEHELAEHLDSDYELLTPPEIDVEDEINDLLDIEEAGKIKPVEEQELAEKLDSDHELLIPPEIDVEDEINDVLDIEEADKIKPVEEQELAEKLDSDHELLFPPEIDVEDEIYDVLDIEEADKIKSIEEQELATHLDSNRELLIPSEIDDKDEMDDPLDLEEADKTNHVEEQFFASQLDSNRKFLSPFEFDGEDEIRSTIDTEEMEKNTPAGHDSASTESVQGEIYCRTQEIPISTHVEIDDFLHAPICGDIVKNTFDFLDLDNNLTPQFETKLFNITTDYPELPDCRLVNSKMNEIIFFMRNDTYDKNNQKRNPSKSVVVPLHNTQSIEKGETNNHSYSSDDFMNIRVPVVLGEYKIETCLEENIVFEKGIVGVKDISSEVVLTNCRFVPNQFSQSLGNGTCSALKGNLFIEGFIYQNIEYTTHCTKNAVPTQKESLIHSNQMCLNIVLELIIHMLQVQKIRVPRI